MSNQWYDTDWQWVDSESSQWGFTTEPEVPGREGLNQIWTDDYYVYAATTSGLEVIDIETEQRTSFATNPNGYTTVWSSATHVFLGTDSAGIKIINKDNINTEEIASKVQPFLNEPDLLSNNVRYIHGNENKLICGTIEGINVLKMGTSYVFGTSISGVQKCFITPNYNYCYYTVSGTDDWQLHRVDNPTGGWQLPNRIYTTGSGFLSDVTCLTDFYVTEHTSISGMYNTVFIATDNGIYIYDEGTTQYVMYTTVS